MVKCSECGFLASRNVQTRQLGETEQEIRAEGSLSIVWNSGKPFNLYEPPICFMQVPDFKAIPYSLQYSMDMNDKEKEKVRSEIQRERECALFTEWRLGSTPKEHQEMIDRQFAMKMEEERRKNDRKWHWIELGALVLGSGLFTLLGVWIANMR